MNQGQPGYQGMPIQGSSDQYSQGPSSHQGTPVQRQGENPNAWSGHDPQRHAGKEQPQSQQDQGMPPKPSHPQQPVVMLPVMYHQLPQPGGQPPGSVPAGWPQYAMPPQQPFPPQAQFVYPTPALPYSYQPHYPYGQYQNQPPMNGQPPERHSQPIRHFSASFGNEANQLPSLAVATQQHPHQHMQPNLPIQVQDATDDESLRSATALLAPRVPVPPYAIATTNNNNGSGNNGHINNMNKKMKPSSPPSDSNSQKKGFRNSRRRHRNSHLGCATCKSRRIKCDEQLPECRNCIRARLTCAYLALDDAAREALKVAQQAHAARIRSLNLQANQREAQKAVQQVAPQQYPYEIQGLPTRIFMNQLPPFPPPNAQPIEINLQRAELPTQPRLEAAMSHHMNHPHPHMTQPPQHGGLPQHQQLPPQLPPQHMQQQQQHQLPIPQQPTHIPMILHQQPPAPHSDASASSEHSENAVPQYAIKSDAYASLSALLKEHKDVDPQRDLDQLPVLDSEFTEIVLDPDCMMSLNKYWPGFDTGLFEPFELGFENEELYQHYDKYHQDQMTEAQNNIVLFKSLLSSGASFVLQKSTNSHAKDIAKGHLDRDFEITLRYLNKFRMKFSDELTDVKSFYLNVSMAFSTFQTYQTAFLTTFYGDHSLCDNYEFLTRFFDFLNNYLNNEFTIFLRDDISAEIKETALFKRAELLNSYMHVFIVYYVQCIKAVHTKAYSTDFMSEFLIKLKAIRSYVYTKVDQEDKDHYDNLVEFISQSVDYWNSTADDKASSNRIQVVFYSLKKFLSLIPDNSMIGSGHFTFEQELIYAYYHAAIGALKAIYSETRFFFLFSFNGNDGTRTANHIVKLYDEDRITDSQKNLLKYPITVIKYFKKRSFIFSQYLKNVSKFPAKIMLDDTNKQILLNLVQEKQLESFNGEIKDENYPHIDSSSNFYDEETKSIVIPSVSATRTYSNFETAQVKRSQMLKKSVTGELSEPDKKLITGLFGKDKVEEVMN